MFDFGLLHTHPLTHIHRHSEGEGKYVQDGMQRHGHELGRWAVEDKSAVYVCG